jgi:hypothetical protein
VPQYNTGALHTVLNVLYWEGSSSGYTIPMLQAAQAAFDGAWYFNWVPLAGNTSQYLGSVVTDMGSTTGLKVDNSLYTPHTGTAGGTDFADNTCYLISLKEGLHYKGGHSRIYIPGVNSAWTNPDGNTINATAIGHLNTLWTQTVTAMAGVSGALGGPYNAVVWHKKLHFAPNTVQVVTQGVAQARLATQRRRLRKAAHH